MFYHPEDGHGLPHSPFTAVVSPRPIGWIATRGSLGDNLAPYSFFNAVAYAPMQVMFASNARKDSLSSIEETKVFAVNIVEYAMREAMNATSASLPRGTDEFVAAGVPKAECLTIPCPRVEGAPATLECVVTQIVQLEGRANFVVFGRVTGVHLRDDCLVEGRFDVTRYQPVARGGYFDYSVVREVFGMIRPD